MRWLIEDTRGEDRYRWRAQADGPGLGSKQKDTHPSRARLRISPPYLWTSPSAGRTAPWFDSFPENAAPS